MLTYLKARRAVDARVGHGQLPLAQEAVLLLQAGENPPFEGIVLSIADTVLDLSFRRGMYGRVGKNTKP